MRPKASQIIGIIIASFLVGIALKFFGISPVGFWRDIWASLSDFALWVWTRGESLIGYILTGAAIVVPIFLITQILKRRRG